MGGVPRSRRGARHRPARVRDHGRRDRAAEAGGGQGRPRWRRADRAHRPHRLRRRAALPRPASGDVRDRPGAEGVQGRARRGEPAAPLLDRAPLGGDPQRPRRRARARARRQRRQPVRDARGRLRRRLLPGRRQRLRRAVEGDREGDLDDRHPRGPRLRAPVLLDRDQARARGDLPDRGVRRVGSRRRGLPRSRRRHRRAPSDLARGRGGGEAGEDLPLLSQGLQGGGRRGERHRELRGVLGQGARARGLEPDLDAPHHRASGPIAKRSARPPSTAASAITTTRS